MEKRNFGLDIIRSIAIIMVVFGHYLTVPFNELKISIIDSNLKDYTFFYRLFMYILGIYGVELFFVLSGFLIGKILINLFAKKTYKTHIITFYIRRWFRTLPLYYLFLLIYIFVFIIFPLKANVFYAILSKFKFFFFLQNFDKTAGNFYSITWSLVIEEWFYLLCPLVFAILHIIKTKPEKLYLSILKIIIFIAIIRFYFVLLTSCSFLGVRCTAPLRFDALLIGVWFSCLKINNKELYNKKDSKK